MFYDKRHDPAVQDWYFRMINDPECFEKWRYKDTINDYKSIIEESQKLLELTPLSDQHTCDNLITALREARMELKKTMAEYNEFKKFKAKTAISK
jgi:transposase